MSQQFSLLIPVYNEKDKFKRLLQNLQRELELLTDFKLGEIFVVASGDIKDVKTIIKRQPLPIKLLVEEKRGGKAKAIQLGLKQISTELVILTSGDLELRKGTIQKLLSKLTNRSVGAVTGKPVPKESKNGFLGYFKNLTWSLHHYVSQVEPKAGEILAFRNLITSPPEKTAADEEFLKYLILKQGYQVVYEEAAQVYNNGPNRISQLFNQRQRIYIGHLDLKQRTGYVAPSMDSPSLFKIILDYNRRQGIDIGFLFSLWFEFAARLSAFFKYHLFHINPYVWDKVD